MRNMKKVFIVLFVFLFAQSVFAQGSKLHKYYEKDYQRVWCSKHSGVTEVVLPDKARVDCVTKTHAIEFDFAQKWAESIGQALYYGDVLNKSSGIVLIVEDKAKDQKYIKRVQTVARNRGISLWFMYPEDM